MSTRIPARRLGQPAFAAFRPRSTYWISSNRAFSNSASRPAEETPATPTSAPKTKRPEPTDLSNPILDRYLATKNKETKVERPTPKTGALSRNSIFKAEYEVPGYEEGMSKDELAALRRRYNERERKIEERRQAELHSLTLDPVPRARRRFERKMVIKSLEKRRVGKAVQIARTERESVYKSQEFPTSVKKMMRLTRLVAGKTVEEALIQLRFSKKRVARDLVKALQIARDEAIAARGMGLGAGVSPAQAALEKKLIKEGRMQLHEKTSVYLADGTRKRQAKGEKTVIELKDGSTKAVADPTEIYIDQAWASKASEQKSPEFRARGKVNLLTHRSTRFNVLLKEEKTRMRISDEIKEKRAKKPLWLPLRDRPVTTQRQYCLW